MLSLPGYHGDQVQLIHIKAFHGVAGIEQVLNKCYYVNRECLLLSNRKPNSKKLKQYRKIIGLYNWRFKKKLGFRSSLVQGPNHVIKKLVLCLFVFSLHPILLRFSFTLRLSPSHCPPNSCKFPKRTKKLSGRAFDCKKNKKRPMPRNFSVCVKKSFPRNPQQIALLVAPQPEWTHRPIPELITVAGRWHCACQLRSGPQRLHVVIFVASARTAQRLEDGNWTNNQDNCQEEERE